MSKLVGKNVPTLGPRLERNLEVQVSGRCCLYMHVTIPFWKAVTWCLLLLQLSLDTALKLRIPEEHDGGEELRWYTLEDLRELQNKLMLMSGKDQGQHEVDHFAEAGLHVFGFLRCAHVLTQKDAINVHELIY